jgi:hypothetical protein
VVARLYELAYLSAKVVEAFPPFRHQRQEGLRPLDRLRHVRGVGEIAQLDIRVPALRESLVVALVEGGVRSPHDLHVLQRHRGSYVNAGHPVAYVSDLAGTPEGPQRRGLARPRRSHPGAAAVPLRTVEQVRPAVLHPHPTSEPSEPEHGHEQHLVGRNVAHLLLLPVPFGPVALPPREVAPQGVQA